MTDHSDIYGYLLKRLHVLTTQGHGDSDDADNTRAEMAVEWDAMTDTERGRMTAMKSWLERTRPAPTSVPG